MNIIFDHRAGLGKITQMDFIYAPCAAYPLPSEELQAVESGARIVGRFFWPVTARGGGGRPSFVPTNAEKRRTEIQPMLDLRPITQKEAF